MKKKIKIISIVLIIAGISFSYLIFHDSFSYINKSKEGEFNQTNLKMNEKELIHYKMLNSIDFFKNVEGELNKSWDLSAKQQKVDMFFTIDNEQKKSYINETINGKNFEMIYDGKKKIFNNFNKTYRLFNVEKLEIDKSISMMLPKDRTSTKKGKIVRQDGEFLMGASECLFNQDIALSYVDNYANWSISGKELYLNRECIKINGVMDEILSKEYKANKFELLVDEQTGILMMFNILDEENIIKGSILMKNIKINEGIDDSKFNKDTSGYTETISNISESEH